MGEPVYVCAIQADGKHTSGQVEISKKLKNLIPDFKGFPDVVKFKNGKVVQKFSDQRNEASLMKFCGL